MTQQNNIKIELTIAELNTVLTCLGKQPYELVFQLVDNITKQASPQVNQQAPEQE